MENQIEVPYHMMIHGYGGGEGCLFQGGDHAASSSSSLLPWCLPSHDHHQGLIPSIPSLAPPFYKDLHPRRPSATGLQLPYDHHGGIGIIPSSTETLAVAASSFNMASECFLRADQGSAAAAAAQSSLFGTIHAELGKMTAQQIMDAKALAASKSHSEAERRRRERINGHLAKLRSMLPNTTKTDKASLLAEVIQHVKELKRQTMEIAEESPLPTESDEISVNSTCDEDGKFVVRASLCCDDRSDLLPDLIKALKALRLRALKAEITTVGGRIKNVLVVAGERNSSEDEHRHCVTSIQDALKSIVEQTAKQDASSSAGGGTKRQRTTGLSSMIEQRSM